MVFTKIGTALVLAGAMGLMLSTVPAQAQLAGTTPTGFWKVIPTQNPLSAGVIVLKAQGTNVIGHYGKRGSVKGTVSASNPREMDLNWSDERGTGWGKITFSKDWNQFHGQWGYPGQAASGQLYASRMLVKINTTGMWNVRLTGQKLHVANVQFHQKGTSFVGKWPSGHFTGTIPAGVVDVDGTWQTIDGSGPLHITFSVDGNSFSGYWAYPGKPMKGRIFGTRINSQSDSVGTR